MCSSDLQTAHDAQGVWLGEGDVALPSVLPLCVSKKERWHPHTANRKGGNLMKKQIIALVMISLMTLTVLSAAAVTTTQKADAAPPKYYNIAITENGKWTQCNLHETLWVPYQGSFVHSEWSRGNTAFVYGNAVTKNAAGEGRATVGVKLRLNTGELTWGDVKEMPIVVKITMRYNLLTLGTPTFQGPFAGVGLIRPFQPGLDSVYSYPGHNLATTIKTATFVIDSWNGRHLQVGDLFHPDPELGVVGGIPCVAGGIGQARPFLASYSAMVTVDSMELL